MAKRLWGVPISKAELTVSPAREIDEYLHGELSLKNAEIAIMLWAWQKEQGAFFEGWKTSAGEPIDERLLQLLYHNACLEGDPLKNVLRVAAYPPDWVERFIKWCKDWWEGEK